MIRPKQEHDEANDRSQLLTAPLPNTHTVQMLFNSRSQFTFSQPTNLCFPWITWLHKVTPVTTWHIQYVNHRILCKLGLGAEIPNNLRDIFPTFITTINATQPVVVLRKSEQINVQ